MSLLFFPLPHLFAFLRVCCTDGNSSEITVLHFYHRGVFPFFLWGEDSNALTRLFKDTVTLYTSVIITSALNNLKSDY